MPLDPLTPQLDTRSYEELRRQALLRIPRYTPEWTDWNESDPGVTLVELFAWLTETMLFEMNRVPERHYLKFLQALGLELRPARPATAYLTFSPKPDALAIPSVPRYTQVAAQPSSGGRPTIFETQEGLDLIRRPLTQVQVFDGSGFSVETSANQKPGTGFRPFGWQPLPGNALYFGFSQTDPPVPGEIFPQLMRWRAFLPLSQINQPPLQCENLEEKPVPPVSLVWEYRPHAHPDHWRRLQVYEDGSAAFTREGTLLLEGPTQPEATIEGRIPEELFWIRVRLEKNAYPAGLAPRVDFIRPNVVEARNLATVRNQLLGYSSGLPDQTFQLTFQPAEEGKIAVVKDSLVLVINEDRDGEKIWQPRDDLLASGAMDRHFTMDSAGGIRFGDGINGCIPQTDAAILAREFRYGGGESGNVASGMINTLTRTDKLTGVDKVTNERPATGGRDEESPAEFIRSAPDKLRCKDRAAVSAKDYSALAREVGGIARAEVLPLFHPDHPGVSVPGALTVLVVPDNADRPPRPSPDQLEEVCRHLHSRRLLTTEVYVTGPDYLAVRVEAVIAANPHAAFDQVCRDVIQALNNALDPLISDPEPGSSSSAVTPRRRPGRAFGSDFYPTSLFAVLEGVKDVRAVQELAVTIGRSRIQELNELKRRIKLEKNQMLHGAADHAITVVPYEDQ